MLGQKKVVGQKKCRLKIVLVPKELLALKNNFGFKINFGPKIFLCSENKMGFKKLYGLYEACVLNFSLLLCPDPLKKFLVVLVVRVESNFSFLLWAKP